MWQDTTTGTKTDTPRIEIPQAITVINRQQLDNQQILTFPEALRWVPGVSDEDSRGGFDTFVLRGFDASSFTFLDGLRVDPRFWISQEAFGLERIEVLRGPASILYGQVAPGGIVNLSSKRPRPEPHYEMGFTAGSDDFYEATVDIGGPLLSAKSFLYRLTGLYLNRSATNVVTDTYLAWTFQTVAPLPPSPRRCGRPLGPLHFKSRSGSVAPLDLFAPIYGAPVTIGPVELHHAGWLFRHSDSGSDGSRGPECLAHSPATRDCPGHRRCAAGAGGGSALRHSAPGVRQGRARLRRHHWHPGLL
jgi:hypothetical protein